MFLENVNSRQSTSLIDDIKLINEYSCALREDG